ncbi:MAG: transaldolase family protein [candidate division FCPU426 bacterium]
MKQNALARLAALNPAAEIWFDSSPLVFEKWKLDFLAKEVDPARRAYWQGQLESLHPAHSSGGLLRGVTTNPPLSLQVLLEDPDSYRSAIDEIKKTAAQHDPRQRFYKLYSGIIKEGAEIFLPLFERSGFKHGFLSGQVDPRDWTDTDAMVAMGVELNRLAPNVMIKMPATKQGIAGIEILTAKGIATNATLSFSLSQILGVAEAVRAGLKKARAAGVDLSRFRSVITMMLGRMEDAADFQSQAQGLGISLSDEDKRWAGVAVFKKAYEILEKRGYESKLLAASMRLGPQVDGRPKIWHLSKLAGAGAVFTIFPNIMEAFLREYDDTPLENVMSDALPAETLARLMKIPYFRQVYDENGLAPDDFLSFGAVQETAKAFIQAAEDMQAMVA